MKVINLSVAQAIIKYLDNQYLSFEDQEIKFVDGIMAIYGHGNVLGIGQALSEVDHNLKCYQGKNEQGMALACLAFSKQNNRKKIMVATSSIGPGAANMVGAAACATANNIPLLILPGDYFVSRQPDPVLQQIEQPYDPTISTNDAFKSVSRYFDRIMHPAQIMSSLEKAMVILTSQANAGAVCIALPQDIQGVSYDYPISFFAKKIHYLDPILPHPSGITRISKLIKQSKRPVIICGGGIKYSNASSELETFSLKYHIPIVETQAGKGALLSAFPYNLGGVGVTGNSSANTIINEADLIIAIGSRLSDFTTSSKSNLKDKQIITINTSSLDACKVNAISLIADAKESIKALNISLEGYKTKYHDQINKALQEWTKEYQRLATLDYYDKEEVLINDDNKQYVKDFLKIYPTCLTQSAAVALINETIEKDAIIVGAAGSLPGDLQRMWRVQTKNTYHMEYGYSCMGYEIAGALGSKIACPKQPVYAFCGDGSFLMLHSELHTARQYNHKIIVLLFDNSGFGCINNLQVSKHNPTSLTEFRDYNNDLMVMDYALIAQGYQLESYQVTTLRQLQDALIKASQASGSVLIDIKVLPKTMSDGYDAWWHNGLTNNSKTKAIKKAYQEQLAALDNALKY
ncbi:MAG: 3D-(3,5/4)-trihydroxycyclohexane-1,2-dione acylhydrolase (decyclizing) [Bacilli bacterium]